MARRVFIAHASEDHDQAMGFRLLRWNINVDFSFFDRSLLAAVDSSNDQYVRRRIREEMLGTSVTVVLLGDETYRNSWVKWEIEESHERGNGLLGIRLKGHSDARIPGALTQSGARVVNWDPEIFEAEIEKAARNAGR